MGEITRQEKSDGAFDLFSQANLTRRLFLGGAGSSVVLTTAALADEPEPEFSRAGAVVQLKAGSSVWTIDSAWFGTEADPFISVSKRQLVLEARFAGTNVSAKWNLIVEQAAGQWGVRFNCDGRDLGHLPLSRWLAGDQLNVAIRITDDATEEGALRLDRGAYAGRLTFPFSLLALRKSSSFAYTLGGEKGVARSIDIEAFTADTSDPQHSSQAAVTPEVVGLIGPSGGLLKLRATLRTPEPRSTPGGWPLGKVHQSTLRLHPTSDGAALPDAVRIHVETFAAGNSRTLVTRRVSTRESRLVIGNPEPFRTLVVGGAELIEATGGKHGLLVRMPERARWMQGLRYAASIRAGDGPAELNANFRTIGQLKVPVVLEVLNVRGGDRARYTVDYRRHVEGGRYLDRGAIVWADDRVAGVDATLTIGRPTPLEPGENRLHLGTGSTADVALHRTGSLRIEESSPQLRARRHEDGLDLGFVFQNWRLVAGPSATKLVPSAGAQRGVRLNPQHLMEEVFEAPSAAVASAPGLLNSFFAYCAGLLQPAQPQVKVRKLGSTADYADGAPTTMLARTRASGPSRIIFEAPVAEKPEMSLSIESLTDWRDLALRVSKRAVGDLGLDEQLTKVVGVVPADDRETARRKVRDSLRPPATDETALELVAGLQFSPDGTARFRTPRRLSKDGNALWTAQLELLPQVAPGTSPPPESRVRAVWATGLDPSAIIGKACPAPSDDSPFKTSLDKSDRSEIVLLTSGFGLAALRSLTLQGQDVTQSLVRLPRGDFRYIDKEAASVGDGPNPLKFRQEGIFSPKPMDRFRARLTSFGADLDLEWQGEPPAPYDGSRHDPFFGRALSIERYVHRTSLGSDIYVQVVYKGFLFPYGFRVSLIKVTEREPWSVDRMGAMMPSIQRWFILPKPVEKTFPGIYQPFGGLEIPVKHARLTDGISPELDEAEMNPPPGMATPTPTPTPTATSTPTCPPDDQGGLIGKVFWPRQKVASGNEEASYIRFGFEADDTGTRRSVPMLFLDNAAVHNPGTVRAVLEYYNGLADGPGGNALWLRKEEHFGGRTIYAEAAKPGDTSFETDHILLKARSRAVPPPTGNAPQGVSADNDLPFKMDAFMEGADEPPFYPVMAEAQIIVSALDRIMGAPQGLKRVGYSSHYLSSGFQRSLNAGELYLNFLDVTPEMSFGVQGEVAGGLSQTPTPLAGISRANAIVGARQRAEAELAAVPPPAAGSQAGTPPAGTDALTPYDLKPIHDGAFNPADFFGDAKLLGIIPLGKAIEATGIAAQPKLKESYEYALGQGSEVALRLLKEACGAAADAIVAALKQAEKAFADLGLPTPPTPAPPPYSGLKSYYPGLTTTLILLERTLRSTSTDNGLTIPTLGVAAGKLAEQWRSVRSEVDAVIANPAPEPVRQVIGDLRRAADLLSADIGRALGTAVVDAVGALATKASTGIVERLIDACFSATGTFETTTPLEALFGRLPPSLPPVPSKQQLRAWVANLLAFPPPVASAEIEGAVLGQSITVPLLSAISDAQRFKKLASEAGQNATAELAGGALRVLQSVLGLIGRLSEVVTVASRGAKEMCVAATGSTLKPLSAMAALALDMLPGPAVVAKALGVIEDRLQKLALPDLGNAAEVVEVRRRIGNLSTAVQNLSTRIATAQVLRTAFDDLNDVCEDPGKVPALIVRLADERSSTLAAATECAALADEAGAAIAKLPEAIRQTVEQSLRDVCAEICLLARAFTLARLSQVADVAQTLLATRLKSVFDQLDVSVAERATAKLAEVVAAARLIEDKIVEIDSRPNPKARYTTDDLAFLIRSAVALAGLERALLVASTDFSILAGKLLDGARLLLDEAASKTVAPLISVHQTAVAQADAAIAGLDSASDVVLALAGKLRDELKAARAAVFKDLTELRQIAGDPPSAGRLLSRWRIEGAGLVNAATTLLKLFDAVAHGQIGSVFDLAVVRRSVEDAVRRLIPSKVNLDYTWSARLEPFPRGSNPIFKPRTHANGTSAGDPAKPDLEITTNVSVDLLKPDDRKFTVTGTLQPFTIDLLGKALPLATIGFKNTEFNVVDGKPRFKAEVDDVQIGAALKFLSALQSLMTTGGNGFYTTPQLSPPGIKVGYAFSSPLIQLGAIVITNVTIDISAMIRFDGSEAEFGFAFASRERPFGLIVAPCYYGGGFVALTANANGIQSMEIQLEFGAATAIRFGPLDAQGRITSGIYLFYRRDNTQRLEGFIHAVGEGQIACFGVSVNIEVKITQTENGDMNGSASYRFSFRVGLVSVGYSFTATYNIARGSGRTAATSGGGSHLARFASPAPGFLCGPNTGSPVSISAPDKLDDWISYRRHFVRSWAEA